MRKDVRIDVEEWNFKYRVCGIVIEDGKVLLQKIKDNKFYCLPGGHVELGEDTKNAVIREMTEETEKEYNIEKLLSINENFFMHGDKKYHEIGVYYILNLKNKEKLKNWSRIEIDKGESKKLTFEWISLDELNNVDFRPAFLKEKLEKKKFEFEHIITNEIK